MLRKKGKGKRKKKVGERQNDQGRGLLFTISRDQTLIVSRGPCESRKEKNSKKGTRGGGQGRQKGA